MIHTTSVKRAVKRYYANNPEGHYFDRKTLQWFSQSLPRTAHVSSCGNYVLMTFRQREWCGHTPEVSTHVFDFDTMEPLCRVYGAGSAEVARDYVALPHKREYMRIEELREQAKEGAK